MDTIKNKTMLLERRFQMLSVGFVSTLYHLKLIFADVLYLGKRYGCCYNVCFLDNNSEGSSRLWSRMNNYEPVFPDSENDFNQITMFYDKKLCYNECKIATCSNS